MTIISVRDEFPAAHRIRIDAQGNLEPVHVHHWRIDVRLRVSADAEAISHAVRQDVGDWARRHRGRSLNDVEPFGHINPTAEEVARELTRWLAERHPDVEFVRTTIGEAAGFSASYYGSR